MWVELESGSLLNLALQRRVTWRAGLVYAEDPGGRETNLIKTDGSGHARNVVNFLGGRLWEGCGFVPRYELVHAAKFTAPSPDPQDQG